MFGTLILTNFLLILGGKSLLRTRLSLISDNQGNIYALLNQKTKHIAHANFGLLNAAHCHDPLCGGPARTFAHEEGLQQMGG